MPRKAYTLEFKQEAVRLVESGQLVSEAAHSLGIVEQIRGDPGLPLVRGV